MKRALLGLVLVIVFGGTARAHVGSPDVFFEGDAGPYRLFVTLRVPDVIPGVATIEIRSQSHDVRAVSVVPLRLTGEGSELAPTPDVAERSPDDPQFFTTSVWLMERGSLQIRITADGARGSGKLAVPVPALAQRTRTMDRGLGGLLLGLMALLALAITSIAGGAFREAALEPGVTPQPRELRRARFATLGVGAAVIGLVLFGNAWWSSEAATYASFVARPWVIEPRVDGCRLSVSPVTEKLLADHGHEMHLFVVRVPALDRLAHLHPQRNGDTFEQLLPSLPAGHYQVFADIVLPTGFPITGTGAFDIPDLTCATPSGDDATWSGAGVPAVSALSDGARMTLVGAPLHANTAGSIVVRVDDRDGTPAQLEPYMMMAGHAAVVATDGTVFAHLHPSGSVAMPALELARNGLGTTDPHAGHAMHGIPATVAFPYGFPKPGAYRVFVQVKLAGRIETGAFDVRVD